MTIEELNHRLRKEYDIILSDDDISQSLRELLFSRLKLWYDAEFIKIINQINGVK